MPEHATGSRAAKIEEMIVALRERDETMGLPPMSDLEIRADAGWAVDLGMTPEQVRNA